MRRNNPFEDLERMLERMTEQFEDLPTAGRGLSGSPAVDVEDHPDEYVVTADLPGFEKDDVDVRLTDQTLRISGERETAEEESEPGQYVRRERTEESVSRAITLQEDVDEEGVSARFKNGVLTVTLPKRFSEESTHDIDIE